MPRCQHTTVIEVKATKKNTSGATSSPNRYNSGISRKMVALARFTTAIHTTSCPTMMLCTPKKALTAAPMRVVTVRTRR